MKPTKWQYFYASNWPGRIVFTLGTSVFVIAAMWISSPSLELLSQRSYLISFIFSILCAVVGGFLATVVLAWPLFGILGTYENERNGAPFQVGDRVHILAGPHKDRVLRIYEIWEERRQVRVELGDEKKKRQEMYSVTPGSVVKLLPHQLYQ